MTRYAKWGCVGDSITYGIGSSNPDKKAYPVIAGVPRDGKPGQALTVAGMQPSLLDTFQASLDWMVAKPYNIQVIVTEIGINDLDVMPNPWYAGAITDQGMKDGYAKLQAMGKQSGVRVILSTITPWGKGNTSVTQEMRDRRTRINKWIRTHKYYVDYATTMGGKVMDPRWDSGDGLHPGDKGHAHMGNYLADYISKHRFKAT